MYTPRVKGCIHFSIPKPLLRRQLPKTTSKLLLRLRKHRLLGNLNDHAVHTEIGRHTIDNFRCRAACKTWRSENKWNGHGCKLANSAGMHYSFQSQDHSGEWDKFIETIKPSLMQLEAPQTRRKTLEVFLNFGHDMSAPSPALCCTLVGKSIIMLFLML